MKTGGRFCVACGVSVAVERMVKGFLLLSKSDEPERCVAYMNLVLGSKDPQKS